MYFISRNNVIYNYIAHTSSKRRYIATLFIVASLVVVCFYGIYIPLSTHIVMYKAEGMRLKKQYEELSQCKKSSNDLSSLVTTGKKNILGYAIPSDKREEHCHKRMLFVLDTISKSGLTLISYGLCKDKDKAWYTKNSAHCEMTGSLENIMFFLKTIKESERMITLSRVALTRIKDDLFQMSYDVGLITIK